MRIFQPVSKRARLMKPLSGLLIVALWLAAFTIQGNAAVVLSSFTATPGDSQVLVAWTTATELDIVGFYIQRSQQQDSGYQRVSTFKPADGDSITGADYQFLDTNLTNGITYWYRLEAINQGQSSEFYDPVSAIPGAGSSPSLTPTATTPSVSPTLTATTSATLAANITNTPTFTPSPTNVNSVIPTLTRTPTATFQPLATVTSLLPTPTMQPTLPPAEPTTVPTVAVTREPTATLLPLPTITLIFPATNTPQPGLLSAEQPTDGGGFSKPESIITRWKLARAWPIGLMVLLWVLLGGWFYYLQHRSS